MLEDLEEPAGMESEHKQKKAKMTSTPPTQQAAQATEEVQPPNGLGKRGGEGSGKNTPIEGKEESKQKAAWRQRQVQ